jgi:hypothetical protein
MQDSGSYGVFGAKPNVPVDCASLRSKPAPATVASPT